MKIQIITLAIVICGLVLQAQVNTEYIQDTLWLKTGEVIPCKILSTARLILPI